MPHITSSRYLHVPASLHSVVYALMLCLSVVVNQASFAETLTLSDSKSPVNPAGSAVYLRDESTTLTVQDLMSAPESSWQKIDQNIPSFGYDQAAYWLRLHIHNPLNTDQNLLLEIDYPILDDIQAVMVLENEITSHISVGDKLPFYLRPIDHRNFLIPIHLTAHTQQTLYLRVQTESSVQVPITLWDREIFFEHNQTPLIGQGLYFGIMLVMAIYNLFIYITVRQRSYIFYVGSVMGIALFMGTLHGFGFQYLWPDSPEINRWMLSFSLCLFGTAAVIFASSFLQLGKYSPRFFYIMKTCAILYACLLITSFFLPYRVSILLAILFGVASCISGLSAGIYMMHKGNRNARYFVLAYTFLLLASIIIALSKLGIVPRNFFTENAMQIGSAIEVILLSFALADRINTERKLRFEAQHEALHVTRRLNEELEERVQERTQQLEDLNEKLTILSNTDQLTGLNNRRRMEQILLEEWSRSLRYQHCLSLIMIDVDFFKRVNDTYGHPAGDVCLQKVASILKSTPHRPSDQVARLGGEEFCVLLPQTDAEGAANVAEKIRAQIQNTTIVTNDIELNITVSLGFYSGIPSKHNSLSNMLKWADAALYQAKDNGRNRVTCYQSDRKNDDNNGTNNDIQHSA